MLMGIRLRFLAALVFLALYLPFAPRADAGCLKTANLPQRCPSCDEYAGALVCVQGPVCTSCCENIGETVDCSDGCGAVFQTTVVSGCGSCNVHCQYGGLTMPKLYKYAHKVYVRNCGGEFVSLAEALDSPQT